VPQTIEQLALTTVALIAGLVLCFFAVRRWGIDDPTDPLVDAVVRFVAPGRAAARPRKRTKRKPPPRTVKAPPTKPKEEAPQLPDSRPARRWPDLKLKPKGREDGAAEPVPKKKPVAEVREPESAVEAEPESEPALDVEAEPASQPQPAPVVERKPKPRPKARPKAKAAAEPKAKAAPKPKAKPTPKPKAVARPKPAAKPKPPTRGPLAPTGTVRVRKAKPAKPKRAVSKQGRRRVTAEVPPTSSEHEDHVPLTDARDEPSDTDEPKTAFRKRFRRGLKRTRERFGREMRTAMFMGATREAFDTLEEALIAADVGIASSTALVDELRSNVGVRKDELPGILKAAMVGRLSSSDRRLRLVRGKLSVWLVAGVNGTGKTTTIAKLGARAKELGLSVCLAAADTFRAAGVEQLEEWGRRLDIDVVRQKKGADPGAVVFDAIAHARASGQGLLIVDTAGRLHTKKPLMEELQKVLRVIERENDVVLAECLLVIDATTGQNGIAQASAFGDAVKVSGLVLSKLDGTAKGGIAFAVEHELGVPVKAVGVGESATDLVPFDPETFVEALIGTDEAEEDEAER
jgi:fused signal recognition particle receptor